MKRALFAFTAILFAASTAAGVVGYDGPKNQPHILGTGSSASGSTAVGPNGTAWSSNVAMDGRSGNITNESVTTPVFSDAGNLTRVEFNGSITAATPCHILGQKVNQTADNSYTLNVKTIREDPESACTQQLVMIDYSAEFKAEKPYNLTVLHDGEEMETFTAGEFSQETGEQQPENSGFIAAVVDFFRGLF
ncbi:MAG: hypothetical protein ABEJ98_02685 [Candidatus Nanohaloarchaea archaeon]